VAEKGAPSRPFFDHDITQARRQFNRDQQRSGTFAALSTTMLHK
jgi:hypothetical protein